MKRILLMVVFGLTGSAIFAQSSNLVLDSTISCGYEKTADSSFLFKSEFRYDIYGNRNWQASYSCSTASNDWEPDQQYNYVFDESGRMLLEEMYYWDHLLHF